MVGRIHRIDGLQQVPAVGQTIGCETESLDTVVVFLIHVDVAGHHPAAVGVEIDPAQVFDEWHRGVFKGNWSPHTEPRRARMPSRLMFKINEPEVGKGRQGKSSR